MFTYLRLGLPVVLLAALVGCGPDYSANTYSTAAVQQANKVDQGVVAGFREVGVRADGTIGAVTGGAAGGVLGAQAPDGGVITALSAIGGTLIGGIVGTTAEHVTGDTKIFEYLVRKTNGDLVSVAQKDAAPLAVGLKVLVIEGNQPRVVPDYSAPPNVIDPSTIGATAKIESKPETKDDKAASGEPVKDAPQAAATPANSQPASTDEDGSIPPPMSTETPAPAESEPLP